MDPLKTPMVSPNRYVRSGFPGIFSVIGSSLTHWASFPEELQTNLEGLLRVEAPTPPAPAKEQEQWQVTKDFKQAFGRLRDLGQQKTALEGQVAKAKAALEEQQEQLTKVCDKLTTAKAEVETCSKLYAEKVLQAQLEPAVPSLQAGAAEAVARAVQVEAEKQELEARQAEREAKLHEVLERMGEKLTEEDRQSLWQILREDAALKRPKGAG